ncbi:hypothetical protein DTO021C3_1832 [Paecilomyces variotii]|nr:hypothetical protein DTO021C3_1832 [Paecilomyces variotii]KAJ9394001.1 hypothetical protein DTO282F9_9058 [Paecilomyces variotii]
MGTILRETNPQSLSLSLSPSLSPPPGWTANPHELEDDESFWSQDEAGTPGFYLMSRQFEDPHLIMRTTPDNGVPEYMFRSGEKYFFWSEIEDTVWEVLDPSGLEEIMERMKEGGFGRKGVRVMRRL